MAVERAWVEYSPPFAPHVKGRYEERAFDPDTRMPEPQRVQVMCTVCKATWQTTCASGQTREHVQKWAAINHLHRDALNDPMPTRRTT